MSIWSAITDYIKGLTGGVASVAETPAQTFTSAGASIVGAQTGVNAESLQAAAQKGISQVSPQAKPTASTDLMLRAAEPVGKAFSYAINRPISTAFLLSDPSSPLYQSGKYEKGFQLSDIVSAYNRSEKVSLGQSLYKAGGGDPKSITGLALRASGINMNDVNLWDDKDIQKNFTENPIGRFITGVTDFTLSNLTGNKAVTIGSDLVKKAAVAANMTRKIVSVEDLAKMDTLADSHNVFVQSNGQMGSITNFGQLVEDLAKSKDSNYIVPVVKDVLRSNNDNLPRLIAETSDFNTVKDIILADKGYVPSFERLMTNDSDILWSVGDTNAYITGHSIASDMLPAFPSDSNIVKAFDKAIERSPQDSKYYKAFMGESGESLASLGSNYKPVDPKYFSESIAKLSSRSRDIRAAAAAKDFSKVGGVTERILGGGAGRPITAAINFVGDKMPRGLVTFGGVRAWDGYEEFKSVLDSIPTLRKANNVIVRGSSDFSKTSAVKYKKYWLNKFANAATPLDRANVIEDFESKFGYDLAATYNFNDFDLVDNFVKKARAELGKLHKSISENGYGYDHTGTRLIFDPVTQRQLLNSMPMLNWRELDNAFRRASKGKVAEAAGITYDSMQHFFNTFNHAASASYLLRPGYIPKNSIIEPMTSAVLSRGGSIIANNTKSFFKNTTFNNKNRILKAASKIQDRKELRNINQRVEKSFEELNQAIAMRDIALANHNRILTENVSPATRQDNIDALVHNLRLMERAVSKAESDATRVAQQFSEKLSEIPSAYGLERRFDALVKMGVKVNIDRNKLLNVNLSVINGYESVYKKIVQAYKDIDIAVAKLSKAQQEQFVKLSSLQKFEERRYGTDDKSYVYVNGVEYPIARLDDPNYFGSAIRNEISNSGTIEMSLMNRASEGMSQLYVRGISPGSKIEINNPIYFDELAYIANRVVRGDKLQDLFLSGKTREDIYAWALTPEGKNYMKQFPEVTDNGLQGVKNFVDSKIDFTTRYFPDPALRQLMWQREVTNADMGKFLSNKLNELAPINPQEVDYPRAVLGSKRFEESINNLLNAGFKKLAAPENAIRWAWAREEFPAIVQRKAQLLADQGVTVTDNMFNDLRTAAAREMVRELEKTFYTVRRNNRALYTARFVASFPQAAASGIYRYGRLAVNNPTRMAGFLRNYYSYYNSFGVDDYGRPVEDVNDATYLIIPGTKELGFNNGEGVQLSAKAFGFLANTPGPSWLTNYSTKSLLASRPDTEQALKGFINSTIGVVPGLSFEDMFPYGSQNVSIAPAWIKNLAIYLNGDESNKDFLKSIDEINNYRMTLWEMGAGPKPTHKEVMNEAKQWWLNKFRWSFESPIGISPKQSLAGQHMIDYANVLKQKYTDANGNIDMDKVNQDMLQTFGPTFPSDRYTFTASTKNAYISPTVVGYNRIWKNNVGLAKDLEKIGRDGKDVSVVGLLTADITGKPDSQMLEYLANPNLKLPGGSRLNEEKMGPDEYERRLNINRGWDQYVSVKKQFTDEAQKRGFTSPASWKAGKAEFDKFVSNLSTSNKDWGITYNASANGDKSYLYAEAMNKIVSDPKFMSQNKNNDFFVQMKQFVEWRSQAVKLYEAAPTGYKSDIKNNWINYLQNETSGKWNPKFQEIIDRYFINDTMKGTIG